VLVELGVSLWCQQVGGTKGVRSVGSAMVSCVAMVPEMSLGVRSVGGLRTVIGYIYGLSEVWKPRGSACMLFLLFSVPPMVGNVILWKCLTHPYSKVIHDNSHYRAVGVYPLLPAGQIKKTNDAI
jgi:hypothetical protein